MENVEDLYTKNNQTLLTRIRDTNSNGKLYHGLEDKLQRC